MVTLQEELDEKSEKNYLEIRPKLLSKNIRNWKCGRKLAAISSLFSLKSNYEDNSKQINNSKTNNSKTTKTRPKIEQKDFDDLLLPGQLYYL